MIGATAGICSALLPPDPVIAAIHTIIANISFGTSQVCYNTFLPGLAREQVRLSSTIRDAEPPNDTQSLLASSHHDDGPRSLVEIISPQSTALTMTTSKTSAKGSAFGSISSFLALALSLVVVRLLGSSTWSTRVVLAMTAAWWGFFFLPAWLGLPNGNEEVSMQEGGWWSLGPARIGRVITLAEIKRLPNVFTFLLAWIFPSDGTYAQQNR
jgi:UMF1 family MFS transporter